MTMDTSGVQQIISALGVVYDPKSTNSQRHEAQQFLETIKTNEESPFWGYQLSLPANNGKNYIVRYFGLSLLQGSITLNYHKFDSLKSQAIRNWIIELAWKIEPDDPHYIKEKVAFLWVSIAKRVWGNYLIKTYNNKENHIPAEPTANSTKLDQESPEVSPVSPQDANDGWVSMDSDLWKLWNNNITCRELSLIILRTLFEDIYLLDDPIASKRSVILNQLSIFIVTPDDVLNTIYESNPNVAMCKTIPNGWFKIWSQFLIEILSTNDFKSQTCQTFVPKILSTFKTCLHWVQPSVLREENIMQTLINILTVPDVKWKTLAIDCLHILFTRNYNDSEDFDFFIGSIFSTEGINKLRQFYQSLTLDADDVDEQVYSLLKKTVEMIVSLSEYLNISSKNKISWEDSDIDNYLQLVLSTTSHPSLIISGLSLQMWVTILRFDELSSKQPIMKLLLDLLEIAADRTISFTLDEEHISKKFLNADFDSTPDANSFLQNYRKFNEDIVRITVCKIPEDGLMWLNNRLQTFFNSELGGKCINDYKLTEKCQAFNYGTSQFNIIENCIRGISRWRIWYNDDDFEVINDRLNKLVESLGERLLAMNLASPLLIRKQVQTLVQFAPLLKDVSPLMFQVLEKILTTATFEYPEGISDEEKELIRDLRTSCGTELNRLAYIMPESLKRIFTDLENVIANILSSKKISDHENVAFKSFLLVIASRSTINDKDEIFAKIVDPELAAWSAPETEKGLLDLHWFMERIGIVEIASYFQSRGITPTSDLLEVKMDNEGRLLKNRLKDHWSSIFPIRATRIFIQYSIEKLSHDSSEYLNLLKLWKPRVQPIIPHILQLLTQIQAYHNPKNWQDLPQEVQSFVKYSCMERFWQQGVSIQTKENFIEENVKAALTLRDFADSVGHLIRYTREYAFLTMGSLSQLEDTLYEIPNIAMMIWKSVAGDTAGITLHSWKHMINSCLRIVIKNCPIKYIDVFMSELLPTALNDLDDLIVTKWKKIYSNGLQLLEETDETLSEEMMEEHMLRQLTATVVRLIMDIVGQYNSKTLTDQQFACRKLIIENQQVLAPFLKICCHIISIKDTKCSFNTILVVRNILSDILLKNDEVDKYLCDYLMKSLIQVLTDDYFVETHNEAAIAFTTLYCGLRSKNDYPARVLIQLLPNISTQHISNFETLLVNSKSLKHQRSALLELIKLSKEQGSGLGNMFDEMNNRTKELEIASAKKKKSAGGDLMNDPFIENGALGNLFGE
ncbi:uncharacterized protein SPAPADRAFT_133068 [Spathaspora passalidarum NRRL Y-27907]|uniref:Importin N-terminal domain-containing protein n=1 Tax=Spathaspora passalidarum (strain NRRL Y-27907 / 11-Y1) TaxID=619300 RepID=G3AH41_SPAPN|nr:uncharacterized protein SPAPADRAFT_133068 [Spathaspora passalidarum NRRL Y-27907]EGW35471.1 hypothetical protein SPAPADRAFT_133068 [Spathaspora passalidarum NRRL Y-27907]